MTARTNPAGLSAWQFTGLIVVSLLITAYSIVLSLAAMTAASDPIGDPGLLLRILSVLVIVAFGALMLARGRQNRATALLGAILLGLSSNVSPRAALDASSPGWLIIGVLSLIALRSGCIGYLWPLFSLEISGGPTSRTQYRIVLLLAVLFALLPIPALWLGVVAERETAAIVLWIVLVIGNQLLGYWILLGNYRRNDAVGRNRIKIALVAFFMYMISALATVSSSYGGPRMFEPLVAIFALGATALLAYATLRHRLFDFGFVLNRTLVYAALSFILLLGFGLAEWSLEHLVPEAWHEGGPLISVAIALALFLSFHRLRDWVEKHVERLLFSGWHKNEATLRRFIGAADHFGSSAALERAFTAEVSRFAGGAEAAIYLRTSEGHYALQAGKLAKAGRRYADDDRALALMRAERGPVDILHAHSILPGELALPLLDQGALLGFVLLGSKPDGAPYRPDEIEVLGWAAQQVGFAAQAQHVRQLEGTIAELRSQVAALTKGRRAVAKPA